jgi:SAM-dependent methyltransferase
VVYRRLAPEGDPVKNATAAVKIMPEQMIRKGKNRNHFEKVLRKCVHSMGLDPLSDVLVVGGSAEDGRTLHRIGFTRITLSNLLDPRPFEQTDLDDAGMRTVRVDAEAMELADNSYDLVLAHEVLHHCRSPHKALLEMLRVSRKYVILLEPNNSFAMRMLLRLRFSFPYELPAVITSGFRTGGVRDSNIPNYIYRWNAVDVYQTTASYLAESEFDLYTKGYWDFNVDEAELRRRSETRIGIVTTILSPRVFLAGLHSFQAVVNHIPWLGRQGNKFFGCIRKRSELKPWLVRRGDEIHFNGDYIKGRKGR